MVSHLLFKIISLRQRSSCPFGLKDDTTPPPHPPTVNSSVLGPVDLKERFQVYSHLDPRNSPMRMSVTYELQVKKQAQRLSEVTWELSGRGRAGRHVLWLQMECLSNRKEVRGLSFHACTGWWVV